MNQKIHGIQLSSGRKFYANRSMVSCVKENGEWRIGEGYDGEINLTEWDYQTKDYVPYLTKEELLELGMLMIQRWFEFMDDVLNNNGVPIKK